MTESHLIFLKDDVYDPLNRIEIIIPLNSIVLESWTIQQETRRKEISGGAVSYDNIGIGSLFMHDSGKSHRLVVPYIDENGIQQLVFWSFFIWGKSNTTMGCRVIQ
jgi:hypothetical protein